ncbi:MAG: ABC transporter permease [Flavobacteriales bacterium]|jgi:ABC-2 type transport system permease protein|uniref:ABC transporter permease n=1 Tax=Candidatus Ulvibacter alkanivorans TaxID=2267620 RepID=UPI000DF25C4A|nr:ABC transporter permease [Candidatus Ulvibacter alkanivorans]MCH2490942.1 ABC transporter permease [Flavobacteriales bacterium]
MLRLLSIEFQKLRYSRSAKVLTITYFVLISFIALIASYKFEFGNVNFRIAEQGIFNFPFIWHFNSWVAAWLKIFLAIVIVSMVSNEYSYKTLKQNLIDGLSKKEFLASKVLTVLLFSVLSTVFLFIVSMILGLVFSDYTEIGIIFSDMEYLLAYFIKLIGFFSFCLFLGVWVKRSAFALGFLALWQIIEGLISLFFSFINYKTDVNLNDSVFQFLPLASMSNLVKEPITRLGAIKSVANQIGGENFVKDYGVHWYQIAIVLFWTLLFIYGAYRILKKRDL